MSCDVILKIYLDHRLRADVPPALLTRAGDERHLRTKEPRLTSPGQKKGTLLDNCHSFGLTFK